MAYRSESFEPMRHELTPFRCGEPGLDTWLCDQAPGAAARRVARTFVWVDPETAPEVVVGYYSLTGHRLVRDDLLRSIGRGSPIEIPAVLLAQLALDETCQGSGTGGVLLADALARIVVATDIVAARFVVVDALHDRAAGFYRHYGFQQIPGTMRLVQKISDVAAALAT